MVNNYTLPFKKKRGRMADGKNEFSVPGLFFISIVLIIIQEQI